MTPQDDAYPQVIEAALKALLDRGRDAGRDALEPIAYPKREIKRRPALPKAKTARIYRRDHFVCRYCGGRTMFTAVMELLAAVYVDDDIFPFHPNWKGGLTHPAVITRSAVIDHVMPGTRDGKWLDDENLVTACWPCNMRKGDLTLRELGWATQPIQDTTWDGLTQLYPALWNVAGRPNERLHVTWMRCFGLLVPE